MKQYLLFDSGCAVCNRLAKAIEEEAAGKLEAVSIRDPRARGWLDQAYPAGWEHQPYLVTVEGERAQASAGLGIALRLGWLLGPRKAWRMWNLGRRYGVVLTPATSDFSPERRDFLHRASLLLASGFFFPRLIPSAPQDRGKGRHQHPSQSVNVTHTKELGAGEKQKAVTRALQSKDVQNVLTESPVELHTDEARAAVHELDTGNTLLAVGIPTEAGALLYYEYEEPVQWRKTEALLLGVSMDDGRATLVSTSVNEQLVTLPGYSTSAGVAPKSQPCTGCTIDIRQYECVICTSWNPQCLYPCCAVCAWACGGNWACFWACVGVMCGGCLIICCSSWGTTCCNCAPIP